MCLAFVWHSCFVAVLLVWCFLVKGVWKLGCGWGKDEWQEIQNSRREFGLNREVDGGRNKCGSWIMHKPFTNNGIRDVKQCFTPHLLFCTKRKFVLGLSEAHRLLCIFLGRVIYCNLSPLPIYHPTPLTTACSTLISRQLTNAPNSTPTFHQWNY